MNAILATCFLTTAVLSQASPPKPAPQLAEPLSEFSWLVGYWHPEPKPVVIATRNAFLQVEQYVRIFPTEDGQALRVYFTLSGEFDEGNMFTAYAIFSSNVNRLSVDPTTGKVVATLLVRDPPSKGASPSAATYREVPESGYVLTRTSDNTWKADLKGRYLSHVGHCTIQITREQEDTLALAITNRKDAASGPFDRGDIRVTFRRYKL